MNAIPPALLGSGVTYRQLDHWARQGWLRVEPPGTGRSRDWPADEIKVARLMAWLTQAGLAASAAAVVARALAQAGEHSVQVTEYVTVVITP